MTFVALHKNEDTSLGTTRWLLSPQELTACESAIELLDKLQALHEERQNSLLQAQEQGRLAGFEQGREEALRTVAPQLLAAWDQAATQSQVQVQVLRDAVIQLSQQVVQRVAFGLAPADVVVGLVARAVENLVPAKAVVVRVHPRLEMAVREQLLALSTASPQRLEVRADPSLTLLDCQIDTPQGSVLAGLNTQLANLAHELREQDPSMDPTA